jgi:putative transposase
VGALFPGGPMWPPGNAGAQLAIKPQRRSLRLPHYDYSQAGAYFLTICTTGRKCLFGEIADGEMYLSDSGRMVESIWNEISHHYSGINVDAFVMMPNHIHGIIILGLGAGPRACPEERQRMGQPQGVAPTIALPDVVHRFKSFSTAKYRKGVAQNNWPAFPGRLWQRNYYEHVIRNEDELNKIREYIQMNPAKWAFDRENPETSQRQPEPQKEIEDILGDLP